MQHTPNILVIRRRYLGDIVLLGSLLRSLKAHWPAARVTALVEKPYGEILALNPDVDSVLALPARRLEWPGFLRRLRRAGFTHVIDIDNTEKTALVARASGAAFRVALHHGDHPLKLRSMYTHAVYDPGEQHEARPITEYYLKALEPLAVPVAGREVRLVPREADMAYWRRFVGARGRVLLVHPGSRSPARIWPMERFAAVCDRVQDDLGAQVVLVGGPGERRLLSEIRGLAHTHVLAVDDPPSLSRFAALARVSSALLCHDSGPMHVAAAVRTPVIALYGSQNPVLFRPHGEGHTQVIPSQPCAPCVAPDACVPGDSYRTFCVRQVTVDRVFADVRKTLGSKDYRDRG